MVKDFRILQDEYEDEDGVKDAAQMQLVTVYMRINTAVVVVMCLCNLCLLMVVCCVFCVKSFPKVCVMYFLCLCVCVFSCTRRAVVPYRAIGI